MTKKLQLNLRMDKEPELVAEMKRIAKENDMSLNDLAIASFRLMVDIRTPIKLSRVVGENNDLYEAVNFLKSEVESLNLRVKLLEEEKS